MPQARQKPKTDKAPEEDKPTRKESRPRIDALLKHIRSGSYDNELAQIQAAMNERQAERQEAVRKLVAEVFGEGYEIQAASPPRARPGTKTPDEENVAPLDPELAEAEERARQEEERLRAEVGEPDDEAQIESRSPIIGSIGQ